MLPIATTDMYAREAFRFENEAALCPFLSGLDEEEVAAQKTEESEIKKEMVHQHSMTEAVVGGSVAGVLTGLLVGNVIALVTGGASKAIEIIAGLISGVVSGLGLGKYVYENENFARKGALIKLEIARYRAIRLDNKVNHITTQLLKNDLSLQEKQQLWKAKFFFQETLKKYSGVRISEPKADQPSHDAQGARNREVPSATQERHDEARTTPQRDTSVQTEPPKVASVAVSSESEEKTQESHNEGTVQGEEEKHPQSEPILEIPQFAKENEGPLLEEESKTSSERADSGGIVTDEVLREKRTAQEIQEVQASSEREKQEKPLDCLSPQGEKDEGLSVERATPCPHGSEEWTVSLPEDEEPLACKMAAAPFMEKGAVENVQQKIEQEGESGLSDAPFKLAHEEEVVDVPAVLHDQEEESAKLRVTIAQVDELQKRGLKLGSTSCFFQRFVPFFLARRSSWPWSVARGGSVVKALNSFLSSSVMGISNDFSAGSSCSTDRAPKIGAVIEGWLATQLMARLTGWKSLSLANETKRETMFAVSGKLYRAW